MLLFSPNTFDFSKYLDEFKNWNMSKKIALLVVQYDVWNVFSYINEGMQAKGISKQIPEGIFGPKRDENGEWRRLHKE